MKEINRDIVPTFRSEAKKTYFSRYSLFGTNINMAASTNIPPTPYSPNTCLYFITTRDTGSLIISSHMSNSTAER